MMHAGRTAPGAASAGAVFVFLEVWSSNMTIMNRNIVKRVHDKSNLRSDASVPAFVFYFCYPVLTEQNSDISRLPRHTRWNQWTASEQAIFATLKVSLVIIFTTGSVPKAMTSVAAAERWWWTVLPISHD